MSALLHGGHQSLTGRHDHSEKVIEGLLSPEGYRGVSFTRLKSGSMS